jgi:hypothetical protein
VTNASTVSTKIKPTLPLSLVKNVQLVSTHQPRKQLVPHAKMESFKSWRSQSSTNVNSVSLASPLPPRRNCVPNATDNTKIKSILLALHAYSVQPERNSWVQLSHAVHVTKESTKHQLLKQQRPASFALRVLLSRHLTPNVTNVLMDNTNFKMISHR